MAGIDQADDADDVTDIAILCQVCYDNGEWDTMWPSAGHDDESHFGVAAIEAGNEDRTVAWLVTELTVTQAEEYLDGLKFLGPVHLMD